MLSLSLSVFCLILWFLCPVCSPPPVYCEWQESRSRRQENPLRSLGSRSGGRPAQSAELAVLRRHSRAQGLRLIRRACDATLTFPSSRSEADLVAHGTPPYSAYVHACVLFLVTPPPPAPCLSPSPPPRPSPSTPARVPFDCHPVQCDTMVALGQLGSQGMLIMLFGILYRACVAHLYALFRRTMRLLAPTTTTGRYHFAKSARCHHVPLLCRVERSRRFAKVFLQYRLAQHTGAPPPPPPPTGPCAVHLVL